MVNNIVVDFGNIVEEMKNKGFTLCFPPLMYSNVGFFLVDKYGDTYFPETYYVGTYLDKLIRNKATVQFFSISEELAERVAEWPRLIRTAEDIVEIIAKNEL